VLSEQKNKNKKCRKCTQIMQKTEIIPCSRLRVPSRVRGKLRSEKSTALDRHLAIVDWSNALRSLWYTMGVVME
jgi:hypothetical protein